MLGGGDSVASQCRKPEIMADAAYVMLTKDSRSYTGNFAIDDEVLRENGITDMDQYACVPGELALFSFSLIPKSLGNSALIAQLVEEQEIAGLIAGCNIPNSLAAPRLALRLTW